MKNPVLSIWIDFISVFFPDLCAVCADSLIKGEEVICLKCLSDLPVTGYQNYPDNPVAKIFWGRVDVEFASSFCYFEKGNKIQALLHKLKYKDERDIGVYLGKIYGDVLLQVCALSGVDMILPVPLHSRRLKLRGYNQSEEIAKGMAKALNKDLELNNLFRIDDTGSQTRKNRYTRWENVRYAFGIKEPSRLEDKHILIVDDVVTTGATLEACCSVLSGIGGVKISIATIACA